MMKCISMKEMKCSDEQLKQVAGLIYNTDSYIYADLFGTYENALLMLPDMIREHGNFFTMDNILLLEKEDSIAALVYYIDGMQLVSEANVPLLFNKYQIELPIYSERAYREYILETIDGCKNQDKVFLICVSVDSKHRRQGIGSELLDCFCKMFADRTLELDVVASNNAAVKLYKKYGFEMVKEYYGYPAADKLLCYKMRKNI